ncbi:cytidylate kinase [Gregarina niphandrodes]|uniref:(d)CMP kinase n=1 Tax=Gregarina niphandrodes TaxID=110365 RepID=A0A023B3F1_GRENI|nr:cytidylate kinase [Gregarina niphandrodes]EZG55523.1 cytidylate kinase [Gregarina niphandrodes]|eukprot:XP_011131509.1 cytidylate kinase [Gregarina niphandrodes]
MTGATKTKVAADLVVAVDGPASSGKSATFARVAEKLGMRFIDTGLFYRAACLTALRYGMDCADTDAICEQVLVTEGDKPWGLQFHTDGTVSIFERDGEQRVTVKDLGSPKIDSVVSTVASNARVRQKLMGLQRRLANQQKPCIVLGRDIGTVILPEAKIKIYLDSSVEARANRRFSQFGSKGALSYEEVYEAIARRDEADKTRAVSPLVKPDDAIVIDNTNLSLEDTVQRAVDVITGK